MSAEKAVTPQARARAVAREVEKKLTVRAWSNQPPAIEYHVTEALLAFAAEERQRFYERQQTADRLAILDELRAAGWSVAIHNDYRLNGTHMTFWGFTNDGRFVRGEGLTDVQALVAVRDAVNAGT